MTVGHESDMRGKWSRVLCDEWLWVRLFQNCTWHCTYHVSCQLTGEPGSGRRSESSSTYPLSAIVCFSWKVYRVSLCFPQRACRVTLCLCKKYSISRYFTWFCASFSRHAASCEFVLLSVDMSFEFLLLIVQSHLAITRPVITRTSL